MKTSEKVATAMATLRNRLKRVVVFINGKGGAGKTTCTANLGGTVASALEQAQSSKRVLLLQLDRQGDLGLDLGIRHTAQDDDGASIVHAIMGSAPLRAVRDVRPNLDVVCGGERMDDVISLLKASDRRQKLEMRLRFAQAVAAISHEYEWILVDCPPGDTELQVLAMVIARWVVIPATFDRASRYGLEGVNSAVEEVGSLNEDWELLGVLMFAFERKDVRRKPGTESDVREIGQRARVRRRLEEDLAAIGAADTPVFESVISNCRSVAEECRETGKLAAEMADASASVDWKKQRRSQGLSAFSNDTAEGLAADYEEAALEIFNRAKELEASAA